VDLPEFSRLYVFSDGVYEVTRPDDTMMTFAEFVSTLDASKRATVSPIEHVIGAIRTVRGGDQFEDDVSIVELTL
jgi:sigma-B regulation protein RsbU (phosphoserine phosphatase)